MPLRQGRQREAEALAEIDGGIVRRLLGRMDPEVQGVAAAAVLEAAEEVLVQVGAEAAAAVG